MKWRIVAVGSPALRFAKDGAGEYLRRLKRFAPVEAIFVKASGSRDAVEERIRKAAHGCLIIALDERGDHLTTDEFRAKIDAWELGGQVKDIAVLIGGADGHSAALREAADLRLALSRMTLQHELALIVFLEQLYRAYTIKAGEPYHRP
ncbi:MAG: 23S rRNA (pseudouridine(1915)-N(3))-methyltransferase RlmH [Verrucomicrobiales bacterium]